MKISVFQVSDNQKRALKKELGFTVDDKDLESIVNIIFKYRHISYDDVQTYLLDSGFGYIENHVDTITMWLANNADIPLDKSILHLNLKAEYFNEIKNGIKSFEYRLKNKHWSKKLINRHYDEVHFKLGYPSKDDNRRIIKMPYKGYEVQTITHKHFGSKPVEVFAIYSTKETE